MQYGDFASGGGDSEIKYGSDNQTLKWSAVFTPRFFMEAQIGHHAGKFRETSALDQYSYTDLRNTLEFFRGANSYDPGGGPPFAPLALEPVTERRGLPRARLPVRAGRRLQEADGQQLRRQVHLAGDGEAADRADGIRRSGLGSFRGAARPGGRGCGGPGAVPGLRHGGR